jgi:hypothetical protein
MGCGFVTSCYTKKNFPRAAVVKIRGEMRVKAEMAVDASDSAFPIRDRCARALGPRMRLGMQWVSRHRSLRITTFP